MSNIISDEVSNQFFNILNQELSENNTLNSNSLNDKCLNDKCLISQEPLYNNYIRLECGHKFNYLALYDEIVKQKTVYNRLEVTNLKVSEMKCPYCRSITKKLLPYINYENVKQIKGVNCPKKYSIKIASCQWIYKNGKNKGCLCNESAFSSEYGILCNKHYNKVNIANKESENTNIMPDNIYNEICKKYKISQLKEILKTIYLKTSGNKKELIYRLIENKYQFNN